MDASKLTMPTLHLNGSGYVRLDEIWKRVYETMMEAERALMLATPHDRDYYIQGSDAGPKARREHEARMRKVRDLIEEAEAILMALSRQNAARRLNALRGA